MKVFAIASIPQGVTIEQIQQLLPKEVPATLKHYLDGKIELMPVTTLAPFKLLLQGKSAEQSSLQQDGRTKLGSKLSRATGRSR